MAKASTLGDVAAVVTRLAAAMKGARGEIGAVASDLATAGAAAGSRAAAGFGTLSTVVGAGARRMAAFGQQAGNKMAEVRQSVSDTAGAANRFAEMAGKLFPPLAGLKFNPGSAELGKFVQGFASRGAGIARTAAALGVGAETLQELRFAAERAGVPADRLDAALGALTPHLRAAAESGSGAFADLGIDLRDAEGGMRPVAELLPELADALAGSGDAASRAELAVKLFGDQAAGPLANVLGGGRAGLEAMAAEARKVGFVTEEGARNALAFTQAQQRLKGAVDGVSMAVGAGLAPLLTPVMAGLADWISQNQELVAGLATVATALGTASEAVQAFSALGQLLKANPMILAVTAFAAAAYLIYENWDGIVAWFSELGSAVAAVFGGLAGFIAGVFTAEMAAALDGLKQAWQGIGSYFEAWLSPVVAVFDAVWTAIQPVLDGIAGGLSWLADSALGRVFGFAAETPAAVARQVAAARAVEPDAQEREADAAPVRPPAGRPGARATSLVAQAHAAAAPGSAVGRAGVDGAITAVVEFRNTPPGTVVTTGARGPIEARTVVNYGLRSAGR
ncbi:phage tail tape measure protein [Arenibaculum sp.]|uniref:phage tail tape measure protein n=1 Tax=Arenibaculum sp. TaxID=2865862 RepID=UPI002E0D6782|nr:phage tail tape measure protein [Arenibaculum sp.]